ncbi:MAG TPA: hypothetical protein PKL14_01360 [Holophaga sp.]|nr:hypothetical protein [Holophaga sp.]
MRRNAGFSASEGWPEEIVRKKNKLVYDGRVLCSGQPNQNKLDVLLSLFVVVFIYFSSLGVAR